VTSNILAMFRRHCHYTEAGVLAAQRYTCWQTSDDHDTCGLVHRLGHPTSTSSCRWHTSLSDYKWTIG